MKKLWEPLPEKKEDRDPKKKYPEYVLRAPMYSQSPVTQYVYWLSAKGRNQLRRLGYDFTGWAEPAQMKSFLKPHTFEHYTVVTDFLIEATLLPDIQVKTLLHDLSLKRRIKQMHKDITGIPIPDGLLHLITQMREYYLWLEIDMGTEKRDRIQDKVWTIIDYIKTNSYQRDYQTPTPIVVFYCLGEHRRDELVTWIEQKLTVMYEVKKARWFLVGSPALLPDMFFETVWIQPNCQGNRKYVSLLAI